MGERGEGRGESGERGEERTSRCRYEERGEGEWGVGRGEGATEDWGGHQDAGMRRGERRGHPTKMETTYLSEQLVLET